MWLLSMRAHDVRHRAVSLISILMLSSFYSAPHVIAGSNFYDHKIRSSTPLEHAQTAASAVPPSPASPSIETQVMQARLDVLQLVLLAEVFRSASANSSSSISHIPGPPGTNANLSFTIVPTVQLLAQGFTLENFVLPANLSLFTNATDILLIYRTFTSSPYPLPKAVYLSPVVGLQLYPAVGIGANFTFPPPPPLPVRATSNTSIVVSIPIFTQRNLSSPLCASFTPQGQPAYSALNTTIPTNLRVPAVACSAQTLGDFVITTQPQYPPPPPSPPSPPSASPSPAPSASVSGGGGIAPLSPSPPPTTSRSNSTLAYAVGFGVAGGVLLLLLLACLCFCCVRVARKRHIAELEREANNNVALETSLIAGNRAPTAGAMRTAALLEQETTF